MQPCHGHNTRSSRISLWSNNLYYSKTLVDPSDMLRLIFGTSFQHHSNSSSKLSVPSKRPSFEHTGLTCYTLLSPSITFSPFHSEFKTYLFRKSYRPVCLFLLDWSHGSGPLTSFICTLVFMLTFIIFFCFSYSNVQQSNLAGSLLNFFCAL